MHPCCRPGPLGPFLHKRRRLHFQANAEDGFSPVFHTEMSAFDTLSVPFFTSPKAWGVLSCGRGSAWLCASLWNEILGCGRGQWLSQPSADGYTGCLRTLVAQTDLHSRVSHMLCEGACESHPEWLHPVRVSEQPGKGKEDSKFHTGAFLL